MYNTSIETTTSSDNYNVTFGLKTWYVNIVICGSAFIFGLYVTTALLIYQYLRSIRMDKHSKRNVREKRFSTIARILCIMTTLLVTVQSGLKTLTIIIEYDAATNKTRKEDFWNCAVISKTRDLCLVLSVFTAYIFLWTRQRVFYIHKTLAQLNSTTVTVLSYVVLIAWLIYTIGGTISHMVLVQYYYEPGFGCTTVDGTAMHLRNILITFVLICGFMQISLLILFIYPIIRRSSLKIKPSSFRSRKSSSESKSLQRVMRRVKKAIILASVCIISDVLAAVLAISLFSRVQTSFSSHYVLNLTVNMICLILCFDYWRRMLFPCLKVKNRQRSVTPPHISGNSHSIQPRTSNNTSGSL